MWSGSFACGRSRSQPGARTTGGVIYGTNHQKNHTFWRPHLFKSCNFFGCGPVLLPAAEASPRPGARTTGEYVCPKRDNREKGARSEVRTRRSRFEIHTSGAKPETSTAIIFTGARCRRCAIVASADLHPHPLWFEHRALARLRPQAKEPDHTQKSYTI